MRYVFSRKNTIFVMKMFLLNESVNESLYRSDVATVSVVVIGNAGAVQL